MRIIVGNRIRVHDLHDGRSTISEVEITRNGSQRRAKEPQSGSPAQGRVDRLFGDIRLLSVGKSPPRNVWSEPRFSGAHHGRAWLR